MAKGNKSKYTCSDCGTTVERNKGFTQDYCEDCKLERGKDSEAHEIAAESNENGDSGPSFIQKLMDKLPF